MCVAEIAEIAEIAECKIYRLSIALTWRPWSWICVMSTSASFKTDEQLS